MNLRPRTRLFLLCSMLLAASIVTIPAADAAESQYAFPFADYTNVDYTQIPIQETGIVDVVADGDTFRFIEDGTTDYVTIRLLGINTPEVRGFYNAHRDQDMCGAVAATDVLSSLLQPGTRVQLRSLEKSALGLDDRLRRYAFAFNPATNQYDIDVQAALAQSGLAMWFTVPDEAALSYPYAVMIAQAQEKGIGLWDSNFCGPVEQPDANLSVIAQWNASGNDNSNPNGEYIIVRNIGPDPVDVSDWLLRDSSLSFWFTFPGGSILAPNDYRVVHTGIGAPGTPNPRDLYMNSPTALLANTMPDRFAGDGAYLLDKSTAMREWFEYPCVLDCTDPAQGKLKITRVNAVSTSSNKAKAANQEFVRIKNISGSPITLDGYYLEHRNASYPFLVDTVLAPGNAITVRMGKGTPRPKTQYWGRTAPLLKNSGGTISLLSQRNVPISSRTW